MSDQDDKNPPEAEPLPEELAAAESLASRVDELLAGKAPPPVLDADERDLLAFSSMVHAAHAEVTLASSRQSSLIEEAMAQGAKVEGKGTEFDSGESLARARERRRRTWPLAAMGIALAAAILFLLVRPKPVAQRRHEPVATQLSVPLAEQSRASDALVGRIDPEESDHASERIDQIYDSRMAGYRSLQYRRLGGTQ